MLIDAISSSAMGRPSSGPATAVAVGLAMQESRMTPVMNGPRAFPARNVRSALFPNVPGPFEFRSIDMADAAIGGDLPTDDRIVVKVAMTATLRYQNRTLGLHVTGLVDGPALEHGDATVPAPW